MTWPNSRALAALLTLALLADTSCGGGDGARQDPPPVDPPAAFVCTGSAPEHATLCPGTDTGLTADSPRVVRVSCGTTPCSYTCDAGYGLSNAACEPVSPPTAPEFIDNHDGTVSVTSNYSTLVWLEDAHCLEPLGGIDRSTDTVDSSAAMAWAAGLATGACGLTDGSSPGDWQLPTVYELQNLSFELATVGPAAWDLFNNIQETAYWSAYSVCVAWQGVVVVSTGECHDVRDASRYGVWPVRR
jgi:hypothetical protein